MHRLIRYRKWAVSGYFEWQKKGNTRIPHFVKHKDGKIMLLAGMWDVATIDKEEGQQEDLYTFTIVTTNA